MPTMGWVEISRRFTDCIELASDASAGCFQLAASEATSPGRPFIRSRRRSHCVVRGCTFRTPGCRTWQCCKPMTEEACAGNLQAGFCEEGGSLHRGPPLLDPGVGNCPGLLYNVWVIVGAGSARSPHGRGRCYRGGPPPYWERSDFDLPEWSLHMWFAAFARERSRPESHNALRYSSASDPPRDYENHELERRGHIPELGTEHLVSGCLPD